MSTHRRTRRSTLLILGLAALVVSVTACQPATTTLGLTAETVYTGVQQVPVTIGSDSANQVVSSQVEVDGQPRGAAQPASSTSYTFTWDTAQENDGAHLVTVAVTKANNTVTRLSPVLVYTRNQAAVADVLVVGASNTDIAFQKYLSNGGPPWPEAPANVRVVAIPGATTTHAKIQQVVSEELNAGGPPVVVLDIGANEGSPSSATDPGFSAQDDANLQVFIDQYGPQTCLVVVEQGYTSNAPQGWQDGIDAANAAIADNVQAHEGPVVTVPSWVSAHPADIASDGIHLTTMAAREGFRDAMWDEGVARCLDPAA